MPYQNITTPTRAPGRPRDPDREVVILRTVLEVLSEKGYDDLTYEEVARRAQASKATLYRRWSRKRDMVVAAVRSGPAGRTGPTIDSGSLRTDLLELCERLVATLASTDGSMVLTLLRAGLEDPELCDLLETSAGPTGARLPADVLERAVARGELPTGANPFAYEEVVGSVLVMRTLNGLSVGRPYLEQLVDAVVLPALSHPSAGPERGIFSGHPTENDLSTARSSS